MWNWNKPIKFAHLWKLANQSTLNKAHVVRRAYTMKFFFHRWLDFSFDSFLSTFHTWIHHESISEEKIFTWFLIKIFSSEIHFTNQRSIEKNQNNKADYKKKTRKLRKWIVTGGNFFIISRIINWVISQFLHINFKSESRTS